MRRSWPGLLTSVKVLVSSLITLQQCSLEVPGTSVLWWFCSAPTNQRTSWAWFWFCTVKTSLPDEALWRLPACLLFTLAVESPVCWTQSLMDVCVRLLRAPSCFLLPGGVGAPGNEAVCVLSKSNNSSLLVRSGELAYKHTCRRQ